MTDTCYYPDGNVAVNYKYVPCGGQTSACCIPGEKDRCLSNGLCFYPSGQYPFRGACTDRTWKNCFNPCPGVNPTSWEALRSCGGSTYCCRSSTSANCCGDPSLVFDIGQPVIINDLATYVFPSTTRQTFGFGSSTATATATSTELPRDPTAASASPSGTAGAGDTSSGSSTNWVAVGVGAGVGALALIAIAAVTFWLLRRRKNPKTNPTGPQAGAAAGAAGAAPMQYAQSTGPAMQPGAVYYAGEKPGAGPYSPGSSTGGMPSPQFSVTPSYQPLHPDSTGVSSGSWGVSPGSAVQMGVHAQPGPVVYEMDGRNGGRGAVHEAP